MNTSLIILEIAVVLLGLGILLADLWTPPERKKKLGYIAAAGVALIFLGSFAVDAEGVRYAFLEMYVWDGLALFFKRFFLLAAAGVLLMSVEFSDRIETGIAEYYALILFALSGMMLAASANDFVMLFVALELITVSFYILTSFQRGRLLSLEAGIKYLILGALATAFTVYGIALVFGGANTTNFVQILGQAGELSGKPVFLLGLLLVLAGIGFKIAVFPFQIWAPDVYQGAPTPTTAFLAVGSKAAGIVLLLRVLFSVVPEVTVQWTKLLMVMAGVTILYGNLCAIPQRNLKRLLGYSSIAQAGYLLLGVAAMNLAGTSAILFYLGAYLFTVVAAFLVIAIALRGVEGEDISAVSGLHERSPLLAATLALAMISLAGIPPLAGFFGKFLLLKAVVQQGVVDPAYYVLIGVALVGVVISFYYYLGVVRVIYWGRPSGETAAIAISKPMQFTLYACIAGMLYLGLFPNRLVDWSMRSASVLRLEQPAATAEHANPGLTRLDTVSK